MCFRGGQSGGSVSGEQREWYFGENGFGCRLAQSSPGNGLGEGVKAVLDHLWWSVCLSISLLCQALYVWT